MIKRAATRKLGNNTSKLFNIGITVFITKRFITLKNMLPISKIYMRLKIH